ncbi:hypothetical protein IWQ62_003321 [Dispira parvispora]|uniref:Uncharacterized protein n=1 Tax=Dispira parvispora TaxID=1520584 RepID=A0A9W8E6E1_9FUNG|nr:hypothetical protein IWQ62_003321 [Dispira parvispora]
MHIYGLLAHCVWIPFVLAFSENDHATNIPPLNDSTGLASSEEASPDNGLQSPPSLRKSSLYYSAPRIVALGNDNDYLPQQAPSVGQETRRKRDGMILSYKKEKHTAFRIPFAQLSSPKEARSFLWKSIYNSVTEIEKQRALVSFMQNERSPKIDELLQGKQIRYCTKGVYGNGGQVMDASDADFLERNPVFYLAVHGASDLAIALFQRLYIIDRSPFPKLSGDITWRVVRDDLLKLAAYRAQSDQVKQALALLPLVPSDHTILLAVSFVTFLANHYELGEDILKPVNCLNVQQKLFGLCIYLKSTASRPVAPQGAVQHLGVQLERSSHNRIRLTEKKVLKLYSNALPKRERCINALNAENEGHDKLLKDKQRRYSTWKVKWHFKGKGFHFRDSEYHYYNPMMYLMELNAPDVAIALFKRLYRIDGEPTPTPKGDITWRVVRDDMLKYAMGRGLASVVQELLEVLPIIPSDHSSLFAITYLSYAMGEFNAGKVTLPEVNCDYVIDNFHGACLTLKANAVKYEKHELPFKVLWVQAPKGLLKYAGTIDGDSPARKDLSIYY